MFVWLRKHPSPTDLWEITVNDPQTVFVRRHRGPSGYHDEVFRDDDHVLRTLTKLLDDASSAHRKLDPATVSRMPNSTTARGSTSSTGTSPAVATCS